MNGPVKILNKLSDKTGEKDQPLAGVRRRLPAPEEAVPRPGAPWAGLQSFLEVNLVK
jgi:hypothetical protein